MSEREAERRGRVGDREGERWREGERERKGSTANATYPPAKESVL